MPEEIITPAAALVIKTGATKSVLKVSSKQARTEEVDDDTTTAEALAAEISAEQSALAEKQHCCTGLHPERGPRRQWRQGLRKWTRLQLWTRQRKGWRCCCRFSVAEHVGVQNLGKTHAGDPPEKLCFQHDIAAERKELEELEKHMNEVKDWSEQGQRHRVGFMKSQINNDYDYIVSVSPGPWLPTTHINPSDYTTVALNVTQSVPDLELGPA
eukprot:256668-Rhodomonas_salina.1